MKFLIAMNQEDKQRRQCKSAVKDEKRGKACAVLFPALLFEGSSRKRNHTSNLNRENLA